MTTIKDVIQKIPRDIRLQIINEHVPAATANLSNPAFQFLWEAYFIYIDPDAVKASDCPLCMGNVLKNWIFMAGQIAEYEKNYNTLEKL
jgi:hypothetical protein